MSIVPGQLTLPELSKEIGYEAISLRPQHERFVWEFVLNGENATRAYLKVYPKSSRSVARRSASDLLARPKIATRVQQIKKELHRRHEITADDILAYHGQVLKQDVREYFDDDGKPLPVPCMTAESIAIVDLTSHLDQHNGLMYLPRFPSKFQAAVELAKILGLYEVKPQVNSVSQLTVSFISDVELHNRSEQLLSQIEEHKVKLITDM